MDARDDETADLSRVKGNDGSVHLEAHASDHASVNQAARDQHFHYADGARDRRRATPSRKALECPYPGLASFGYGQARWFFGRDHVVAELVNRLDPRLSGGGMQVVIAPSGAGKSSLLHAGLLPRLDQGGLPGSSDWPKLRFTPTAEPLHALATQIASLYPDSDAEERKTELLADPDRTVPVLTGAVREGQALLVVDQFEELFTLCADDEQRHIFITQLEKIADGRAGPVGLVVLGIRADFYATCIGYPPLRDALQDSPLAVGSMSDVELREAILFPAQDAGLDVEAGLVELLLRDLGATAGPASDTSYEAGRLPLLAHAVRSSWQQRHGATLTVQGYLNTGGIQHAIATTAERVYDALDATGKRVAERLFLRTIKVGDGTNDVRRFLPRAELIEPDADIAGPVLDAFTQARLLTQQQETVGITHDALLDSWPRLKRWITDDRAGRLMRQHMEEDASAWSSAHRDQSLLYRGSRLDDAQAWAVAASPHTLSPTAHDFLDAGVQARRRASRWRSSIIAAFAALALVSSTTAVIAIEQQGKAVQQRNHAIYNQVLAEADRLRGTDLSLSAQLDLVAHRMRPSDETYTRLVTAANDPLSTPLTGHKSDVNAVAFGPDRKTLATASADHTVLLWDVSRSAGPRVVGGPLKTTSPVDSIAFSPNRPILATGNSDRSLRFWDVSRPASPTLIGAPLEASGGVRSLAFSPDGRVLATGGLDHTIRLWAVNAGVSPTPLGPPIAAHTGSVQSLAFSPDGRMLATGSLDHTARLWSVGPTSPPTPLGAPITAHTASVQSVTFSPDGRILVTAGDATTRLWNISKPAQPTQLSRLLTDFNIVNSVAISPDGTMLAVGSGDATTRLWDIAAPTSPTLLGMPLTGHRNEVTSVAFSPDGGTLATGSIDASTRLWNIPRTWLLGHVGRTAAVAFSPNGKTLATGGTDHTVRLWDITNPSHSTRLGQPLEAGTGAVYSIAFSPDGGTLATASDQFVRLWNVTDLTHPTPLGRPLKAGTDAVYSIAFSPNGTALAASDENSTTSLWLVANPTTPTVLSQSKEAGTGMAESVAFSPDSRLLATAGTDRFSIRLWNISNLAHPTPIGQPIPGRVGSLLQVAFSPDRKTMATANDGFMVRLWDITDPSRPKLRGRPLAGHTTAITSMAFSPNGDTLASASGDRTVRLWHVADPDHATPLGPPLTGHNSDIWSVAFSPTGKTLATASLDDSIRLWTLSSDTSIQRICDTTGNVLTSQVWSRFIGTSIPFHAPCSHRS